MRSLREVKKIIIRNDGVLNRILLNMHNRVFGHNSIKCNRKSKISFGGVYIRNSKIDVRGTDNIIEIEPGAQIVNTTITVNKNGNRILIKKNSVLNHCEILLYDELEKFEFGIKSSAINCCFYLVESTDLIIGDGCWMARGGVFRTGDGHSFCDSEGNRINPSASILIGEHCWIGTDVVCLKGVTLQPNTVVSACTLLNKPYKESGVLLGGIPARVLKKDINWKTTLMPIKNDKKM